MSLAFRRHLEEIITITDAEFDRVLSHCTGRKFKKHQFLVQEGNPVEFEYFVVKGLLKASYTSEEGKEHIIQFALENWWITDYKAFTTQSKATLNIDCVENAEVLCLSLVNKAKLCAESHSMEHFFRIKTTAGYIAMQQRVLSFLSHDASTRYKQLFALYPSLFQRLPKALIASFLGVSRETLSRITIE